MSTTYKKLKLMTPSASPAKTGFSTPISTSTDEVMEGRGIRMLDLDHVELLVRDIPCPKCGKGPLVLVEVKRLGLNPHLQLDCGSRFTYP